MPVSHPDTPANRLRVDATASHSDASANRFVAVGRRSRLVPVELPASAFTLISQSSVLTGTCCRRYASYERPRSAFATLTASRNSVETERVVYCLSDCPPLVPVDWLTEGGTVYNVKKALVTPTNDFAKGFITLQSPTGKNTRYPRLPRPAVPGLSRPSTRPTARICRRCQHWRHYHRISPYIRPETGRFAPRIPRLCRRLRPSQTSNVAPSMRLGRLSQTALTSPAFPRATNSASVRALRCRQVALTTLDYEGMHLPPRSTCE